MPVHLAAQIPTPSEVVGVIIDGHPEALVMRNNDGKLPGTLAQSAVGQSRDVKNMMQDGRTNKSELGVQSVRKRKARGGQRLVLQEGSTNTQCKRSKTGCSRVRGTEE